MATEVLKRLFSREIASNLFPDNQFYKYSKLVGGVNPDVAVVEIPNAGAVPTVVVNPTVYPLQIVERKDDRQTFNVDLFATKPTLLTDENQLVVSYDKRADVLKDHTSTLNSEIAFRIAHAWASGIPAGGLFPTTGTTTRSASLPSATGTRKRAIAADIQKIQEYMDKQDVPMDGRYAVLPAELYGDLALVDEFISYDRRGLVDMVKMGLIGEIYGFRIFKRSSVVLANASSGALKAIGAAAATTDSYAGLFWHESFAWRAEGNAKIYINPDQAEYLGTVMNAAVRAGGATSYLDGKGVAMLYQAS